MIQLKRRAELEVMAEAEPVILQPEHPIALPAGALAEGDFLELIGPHQSVDDVARAAGTIGYEVLTALGHRYHRIYR